MQPDENPVDGIRDSIVTLGEVDYSFRLSPELRIERPQFILDHARSLGNYILAEYLNKEFSNRMSGGSFVASGGSAYLGSIKIKDGKILISSKALVIILATYGALTTYSEFRSSTLLLANDITSVFNFVMESSFIEGITFRPRPEGQIFHEVLAVLPPDQQLRMKKTRKSSR
ncbi:hypothetical protein ELH06_08525 [Rhizobium ruizarguesonis]|uniref:hypothetical protein n=1 Tax=Rhizobium ruizarguesonis TaxID=2081791 RepID=UPI00102FC623|nr:hypothetical protein [Rhizobium ruizarguesonis]TBE49202.1 hypothetical protein ELH06_08525 [Rhizobium ruizarguesonis]